jgi:hypothetical protein
VVGDWVRLGDGVWRTKDGRYDLVTFDHHPETLVLYKIDPGGNSGGWVGDLNILDLARQRIQDLEVGETILRKMEACGVSQELIDSVRNLYRCFPPEKQKALLGDRSPRRPSKKQ